MSVASSCTLPLFKFAIQGHILHSEGLQELVCADGTRLRVVPQLRDYPTEKMLWHVIPSTDSTSIISTVKVVDVLPLEITDRKHQDECQLVGRVVDLGKRHRQVLLKVVRPGEKTLKLTLVNPDPRMKVGQLWSCKALRVGCALEVTHATCLEAIADSASPISSSVTNQNLLATAPARLVLSDPLPPTDVAQAALERETGVTTWKLAAARQRPMAWEWEAVNFEPELRARVQVSSPGRVASVYQYPSAAAPAVTTPQIIGSSDDLSLSELDIESDGITPTNADRLLVTPLGAAMGIGASCFRVQIGPYEIVLDCGTRTKGHDPLPALDEIKHPNLLVISHAHQDHIGAVPVFHRRWPGVRMICTPGTREIAHVMLRDSLKFQQRNEDSSALFDEGDLERTLFRLETYPVGQEFELLPGLQVRFINAGHIVGAACIYLRYGKRSLLYTGDYNTTSSRTTEGLRLADMPQADILITEGTYGANAHPARKTQETALLNAIAAVVEAGGNVLIPAFALGRAQEILLAIRTSHLFQKLQVPIYVDGLVRAVTDTFCNNLELLPLSMQNLVKQSQTELFFAHKSKPTVMPITHPQERPLAMAHPSVIVASSGMLSGGASVYYAKTLLERENAAVFISGYTDEESPGRLLQSLNTGDKIELDGVELTVRAQIKRFNLSAHADKIGLTQVINKVNPKHLILVHGSQSTLKSLACSGDLRSKHYIHIPSVGELISFGTPPLSANRKQIQRIEALQEFEVEVSAEVEGAWIRIPESVVEQDPRWQMLAGNGVMKAGWDGINLKLSPTDNQDMAVESARSSGLDCCAKCQNFSSNTSQCNSPDSPLSGLSVDPSGYCLEYNV